MNICVLLHFVHKNDVKNIIKLHRATRTLSQAKVDMSQAFKRCRATS